MNTKTEQSATLELGKTYRLYGKMGSMRQMKPVSKDRFVTNLIYADLYTVESAEKLALMEKELAFLQGQGTFQFRYAGNGSQL